jgi:hypothetical protein
VGDLADEKQVFKTYHHFDGVYHDHGTGGMQWED